MIWADVHPDDEILAILIDNHQSCWNSAAMARLEVYILCNRLRRPRYPCINICGRPQYLEVRYPDDSRVRMDGNTGGVIEASKDKSGLASPTQMISLHIIPSNLQMFPHSMSLEIC